MTKKRLKAPENLPDPIEVIAPGALPADGFVRGSAKEVVKATGSLGMKLWLYSPARVILLAEPTRKLAEVAQMRGMPNRKIESLEVVLHEPTRRLFVYPPDKHEDEDADDAFKVSYRSEGRHAEFNIRSLLQPRGLEVTRGWREQYDVKFEPNSECGPALVFQLTTNPVRERLGGGKKDVIEEGVDSVPEVKKASPKRAPKKAEAQAESTAPAQAEAKSVAKAKAPAKGASPGPAQTEGSSPEGT